MTKIEKSRINLELRKLDQSYLWPISGRFNATERAIRRANRFEREYGTLGAEEYRLLVEGEISRIVNSCI